MSSRKKRASKHLRLLGYRVRRTRFYKFLLFVLLVPAVFFVVAYALLRNSSHSDNNGPQPSEARPATIEQEEEEPEGELAGLLWRHRQASGLKEVTGMTLHCSYIEDGRNYEMALSMRAPEMIRKKVRDEAVEVVFVAAGGASQVRTTQAKGESTVRALPEDDLYRYTLLLEGGAFRLAEGGPRVNYDYDLVLGEATEGFRRIVSTGPSGVSVTHVIGEVSGLEVERSAEVWVDETQNVLKLFLEDQRQVDGVMLPHLYRLQINGLERAEIRVQSVQLNPVTPLWFFVLERESEEG